MPPCARPGSFSTMKQLMPSGDLAASATTPARSPLVTHILVPFRTYSSLSGVALHRSDLVSLPASGSDRDRQPRTSPVASGGNSRPFCSSVPWRRSRVAAIMWVLRIPVNDIQPAASSSMSRAYVITSSPRPPHSSGITAPKSPSSAIWRTRLAGYSSR